MVSAKYYVESNQPTLGVGTLARRLWRHLSPKHRRLSLFVFLVTLASAVTELASLGAVLPFLGVLTAPEKVYAYPLVKSLAHQIGVGSASELILPFTILFAVSALVAGLMRLLLLWANSRLAFSVGADIGVEMFRRTLYQPYPIHLSRNSSVVLSGITQRAGASSAVLLAILTLTSSSIFLIAVMSALIAIHPIVALLAGGSFAIIYVAIAYIVKRRLLRNSQIVAREQVQAIKTAQEGLGGIRDVLLDGTQPVFHEQYRCSEIPLRHAHGNNMFLAGAPRLAMEAMGLVLIALLAYALSREPGGIAAVIPILGTLALGAQRLLPVLQQTYASWATITGNQVPVVEALNLLDQPVDSQEGSLPPTQKCEYQKEIRFDSVSFRYTDSAPWVLQDFGLTVPKGTRVGIIGGTGSGKSTVLDILLGLLLPTQGQVLIDGQPIVGERLRAWQRLVAHVPQSIFLADTTVEANIAFGVAFDEVDHQAVRAAAQKAQVSSFIESLPQAYDTVVGERGVRLSGGQRQRIGIARALYKRASVLVLDEATSALDNLTEQAVMNSLHQLDRELTIFVIAHRLTTVQQCDRIVELANGRAIVYSSYEEMMANHPGAKSLNDMVPQRGANT